MTVTECRKLLCLAEKGVTRRSTRPLQNAVLLERDAEDRWRFTASDLEFVDVSTWEDGFDGGRVVYAITLTPKVLKGALKGKPGKADVRLCPVTKTEVDLHVKGLTTTVARLKGLSAEEFETIPASEGQHSCDLSERDQATVQHVGKASSTDETRPTLTGVLFRFGEDMNHPEVSATDTHRLAKSTLDAEAEGTQPGADYITHRSALTVLAKASKGEGAVRASFSGGTVEFLGTNWRLRTRGIDGQFPNYPAVIPDPQGCVTGFVADSEALRASVEGLLSVASEDGDRVVFAPEGEGLRLSARAEAVGEAHAELEAEVRGPGDTWPFALNGRYLLDALPEGGPVTVSWGPFPAPARIEGEGETVGVVMPMELGGFEGEVDAAPEPVAEPVAEPVEAPKPVCAVCEDTGELYTVRGEARPCPTCRSTVETSPEPVEVPAEAPEVVTHTEEPEAEPVKEPTELLAPTTPEPVLSLVDKTTRKDDIRRSLDEFCQSIAAGVGDETFDQFLAYAARFHRYSWRNTLLIMLQKPEATFVAGFRRWIDLGRKVKKGVKAVWILAPRRYTKTVEAEDGGEEEVERLTFRPVPVYADVDTEGDVPVQNFRPDLAEAAELLPVLQRMARTWGVPFLRRPCEGNGWSDGARVNVDPDLPDGVAAQTLLHELAHHALKHRELAEKHGRDRMLFEGEAEAVKVVVLRHLGIDTRSNGAAYLRAHGADADLVKRSATRIVQTAKEVIEALEAAIAEPETQPVAAG